MVIVLGRAILSKSAYNIVFSLPQRVCFHHFHIYLECRNYGDT